MILIATTQQDSNPVIVRNVTAPLQPWPNSRREAKRSRRRWWREPSPQSALDSHDLLLGKIPLKDWHNCCDVAGMNKCLGNIEILYQTVWGVQWAGPRQNYTRKEPQLNTSLGKAVRKKLCKEQLIKHPPPTPNPKLLPNPIAFTLPSRHLPSYAIASAVPHPDCRCQRQLHLENLNGSPLLSGSPDVGWCREFYVQRPCPPFSRGGFRRKYDLLVMPQISFKNWPKAATRQKHAKTGNPLTPWCKHGKVWSCQITLSMGYSMISCRAWSTNQNHHPASETLGSQKWYQQWTQHSCWPDATGIWGRSSLWPHQMWWLPFHADRHGDPGALKLVRLKN